LNGSLATVKVAMPPDDGAHALAALLARHQSRIGQISHDSLDSGALVSVRCQLADLRPTPRVLNALPRLGQPQQHRWSSAAPATRTPS
jgi:hypothetical protein